MDDFDFDFDGLGFPGEFDDLGQLGDALEPGDPPAVTSCWHDVELFAQGLDLRPEDDVLLVTDTADAVFRLLLDGPRSLTVAIADESQGALVGLQVAALRALDHQAYLDLVFSGGPPAATAYEAIRFDLDYRTRAYWDQRRPSIERGLAGCGRLEQRFARFRSEVLPGFLAHEAIEALLAAAGPAERTQALEAVKLDDLSAAFGEAVPPWLRPAKNGDWVETAAIPEIESKLGGYLVRALTQTLARNNPYLRAFLVGPSRECAPDFLSLAAYTELQQMSAQITSVPGSLERVLIGSPPGAFNKVAMSDGLDVFSPRAAERLFQFLSVRLRPGARCAHFTRLVRRHPSEALGRKLLPLRGAARGYFAQARSFLHGDFHIAQLGDTDRLTSAAVER